ncbi:MAG: carboxylate--amine ligase [Candidatus Rokuibacteriota bacterium]|nr:MAG: carboxylate--amine ligase [Candidatus Rokubacteria bacterium]
MGRPDQFAARAASRSARVTCGLVPGRFAQPADRRSAVSCHPPPRSNAAMLPSSSRPVNPWFVLDSTPSSSRRFAMLTIHALPDGRRRPILIMAFSGWNDAAEAATTAARYLATAFRAEKFAEIDPEEFYHFGLSRPYVRFKAGSETDREIVWPVTEFSIAQVPDLARDLIVGVAAEPHLKWKTYCATVLELARRCEATVVLTLGALLAEVPHTRPVRLVGGATDAELAARLGIRPTRYEGPTGIVGALSTICRDQGFTTASLWANVPHYISGIENPKATLALVRRVLPLLGATLDLVDLEDAGRQFDQNLTEIVRQNAKIANYVKKLESRDTEEPSAEPSRGSDLPPASELVAEIEQFLRQQRPE